MILRLVIFPPFVSPQLIFLLNFFPPGGVEKLFALPGRTIAAVALAAIYQRQLSSEATQNEDFGMAGDKELENLSLDIVSVQITSIYCKLKFYVREKIHY